MDQPTQQRLRAGALALGVDLSPGQLEAFSRYLELLVSWNRRINLTGVTRPAAVVDRHFLDSLAVAPLLAPGAAVLDVGTGAGLPGAALALARPDLRVSLCEGTQKKVAFLRALARTLDLAVEIIALRSEELLRRAPAPRFDAVVSRAALPLAAWAEHGRTFVAPAGLLVAWVASLPQALPCPEGFGPPRVHPYHLPDGTSRNLVSWRRAA